MLLISIPMDCESEQRYAIKVVLNTFLGLAYKIKTHQKNHICITQNGSPKGLYIDTSFSLTAELAWLKPKSMPILPLMLWDNRLDGLKVDNLNEPIPVLYGKPKFKKNGTHYQLDIDIFGSIFFMLSRYEELVTKERDKHGRFPATASIAYKARFLDSPIVDHYTEILWACLTNLWPNLIRKKRTSKKFITCDVDWPFDPTLKSFKNMTKQTIYQLIKNKEIFSAFKTPFYYFSNKLGCQVTDQYEEAINWIMSVNEKEGNIVTFFFTTYKTSNLDTDEDFDSNKLRNLFRNINHRGHKIGLHPGYETFNNPENFSKSVQKLKQIFKEEGIIQKKLGGRQHFLRWDSAQTPHLWEKHGFSYDSTLAYADLSGFRCGTSKEFNMYNLIARNPFKLKQRPLITMECTIISKRYEGLAYTQEATKRFDYLKKQVYIFGGTYTLLWHNSHFSKKQDRIFYQKLIK